MRTAVQITSADAYDAHKTSGKASAQCSRILRLIEAYPLLDWSIGETARELGMEKSTVSARIKELLDAGTLEPKPNRKDRISHITVRPVGLPVKGQLEFFA